MEATIINENGMLAIQTRFVSSWLKPVSTANVYPTGIEITDSTEQLVGQVIYETKPGEYRLKDGRALYLQFGEKTLPLRCIEQAIPKPGKGNWIYRNGKWEKGG